jgi:hypothetical protein
MTQAEIDALANVVDYNWAAEQADFDAQDEDGQIFHVFGDLGVLAAFLEDTGNPRAGA